MECKAHRRTGRGFSLLRDLIETLWNVKDAVEDGSSGDRGDLIETLWNVKKKYDRKRD